MHPPSLLSTPPRKLMSAVAAAMCLAGFWLAARPAAAAPVTLHGVTFSDEMGGLRILDVSGSGTETDPFVVVEEITDPGDAVLVIRGVPVPTPRNPRHNRILSGHAVGFALRKIAINATGRIWPGFDLELQTSPGTPSPWRDGLSFGQGSAAQKRTGSDMFERATITAEPIDSIVFSLGDVAPGGRVALDFVITDMTLRPAIFLVQRRHRRLSLISRDTP